MQYPYLVFCDCQKIFLFSLQKTDILLCLYGYTGKNCEKFKEETSMKKEKDIIREEGNYDPYEEIANAIVIQACNDYKNAYRRHLRRSGIVDSPDYELRALENFFRSDWYKILTSVDGEYLMERLRKEVLSKKEEK